MLQIQRFSLAVKEPFMTGDQRSGNPDFYVGLDATLFGGLTLTADAFYEKRQDIWVYTGGKNSSILGAAASYANAGVVDSKGLEFGANYIKSLGKVRFNFGGTFTLTKNKIVDQQD